MKIKSLAVAAASALAMCTAVAGTSQAATVAGWDFSQYFGPALLSVDGATFTNELSANYSNLDPSGLGPESAAFGTMYINGQYGSSFVVPDSAAPQFIPTDINLSSNINGTGAGFVPFNSLEDLAAENQPYANPNGMVNQDAVQVVFGANLMGVPQNGSDWAVSLGGRTESGTAAIQIEFSTDGSVWLSFGSVNLTTVDTPFNVALGTAATDTAFVRLTFAAPSASVGRAVIDNVAFTATLGTPVPEPTAAMLCCIGLGVALLSSLRRSHA